MSEELSKGCLSVCLFVKLTKYSNLVTGTEDCVTLYPPNAPDFLWSFRLHKMSFEPPGMSTL